MFRQTLTKESIRRLLGRKKLPKYILLHITSGSFYNLLRDNGLEGRYQLMHLTYNLACRSSDRRHYQVTGKFSLLRKPSQATEKRGIKKRIALLKESIHGR